MFGTTSTWSKLSVSFLFILYALIFSPQVWAGPTPPGAAIEVIAAEDSYVDSVEPTTPHDERLLGFEVSHLFDQALGEYCPTVTQITYLKFDLSGVPFAIDKARLNLATVGECASQPVGMLVQLFAAADGWGEDNLTWNNQPPAQAIFSGLTDITGVGYFNWTDDGAQPDGLADWLAGQQNLNGGDNVATLGLITPLPLGCSADPLPRVRAVFEDNELSGPGLGCTSETIPPTLQVVEATEELPPPLHPTPTAVNLRQFDSTAGARSLPGLAWGAALLSGLTLVAWRRRDKAGRTQPA